MFPIVGEGRAKSLFLEENITTHYIIIKTNNVNNSDVIGGESGLQGARGDFRFARRGGEPWQ